MIPSIPVHGRVHASNVRADRPFVGTPDNNVPSTDTPSADGSSPMTAVADTSPSLTFLTATPFTYPLTIDGQDLSEIETRYRPRVTTTPASATPSILLNNQPTMTTMPLRAACSTSANTINQASNPPRRGGGPWTGKQICHVQRLRATHLDSDGIPNWNLIYQEYQKTYDYRGRTKHSLRKKLGQVNKAAQQTGTSSHPRRKWGMVVPNAESDAEGEVDHEDEEEGEEGWDGLWEA